jgi:glycosyltransferase involved in cell wall biosynthesis
MVVPKKIRILEMTNVLGFGGTEYALQLFCKYLDKENFDVTAIGLYGGGPREKLIGDLGVKVEVLNGDFQRLQKLVENADVVHYHGSGLLDNNVFNVIKKPKLVIQTNVFGFFESSPLYDLIDYDLYVSKMMLVRRMKLDAKLNVDFSKKRKVLYNPVDVDHIQMLKPKSKEIECFKKELSINDCFIVGRIGRSDDSKFDLITLDGFAIFAEGKQNVKFLLCGATPVILRHAEELKIMDKLVVLETTSDFRVLLLYYACLDLFLNASNLGESFGMVIAEAMAMGVPVVTINTPNRDNAQVELVDDGVTGFVVPRLSDKISEAIGKLYYDEVLRNSFSIASKDKVTSSFYAQHIVDSLKVLILNHYSSKNKSLVNKIIDYSEGLNIEYSLKQRKIYKSLTFSDRVNLETNELKQLIRRIWKKIRLIQSDIF